MKKYLSALAVLSAAIIFIPAVPVIISGETYGKDSSDEYILDDKPLFSTEPYKVLNSETGEIMEVPVEEYVIGAVCAEMPASFETEALKAQAVAAHTYAERQRLKASVSPEPELCGADFSDDTSKYQGFFTNEEIRRQYGENYESYYAKIKDAVSEVLPYIITYQNEPIISAFHSMSSGKTESAENVWGTEIDYLVSVDSSFDKNAPKYLDEVSYSRNELENKLKKEFKNLKLGNDLTKWIQIKNVSDSGTVLSVDVGGENISGSSLRDILGLRSACFDVKCKDDKIIFTTKGFGHGVGMSQYGADAMASEGSKWRDIIAHYYPHASIVKI
ncbi:MAG: stage II sporulation protein D [Ruminococcus sp.]|nr:stage II sporulation protein D [Ruminococcus sp.]